MSEIQVQETQFSTREVPWLKLGKLTEHAVTAAEAAKLAGLDFEVELLDVGYHRGFIDDTAIPADFSGIPERRAVVARDNGQFMGFASTKMYQALQYSEAFDFMDTIGAPYVAAGGLRKRRQGFMVVKPEIDFNVLGGQDPHDLYAVLRTSHDCTRGIEVSVMPLRGRCMNQLTLRTFAKGAQYRWAIKHNTTMHAKLKDAQDSLKRIGLYAERFKQVTEQLAATEVKQHQASKLLEIIIPRPVGRTDRVVNQWSEKLDKIMNLWNTSPTVGFAGTGWGLVNAVSDYYDWGRSGGTPESRFLNALEGETHKKVNKVAGLLLAGH